MTTWDEIMAELGASGLLTGTVTRKDDKGVTRTVKLDTPPCGDITDDAAWVEAGNGGGSISDSAKADNGAKKSRTGKEASGKQTVRAVSLLLGITFKGKRSGRADTVTSDNGTANA